MTTFRITSKDVDGMTEALTDYYGKRCEDYDPECRTCRVWAAFYMSMGALADRIQTKGLNYEIDNA